MAWLLKDVKGLLVLTTLAGACEAAHNPFSQKRSRSRESSESKPSAEVMFADWQGRNNAHEELQPVWVKRTCLYAKAIARNYAKLTDTLICFSACSLAYTPAVLQADFAANATNTVCVVAALAVLGVHAE